MADALARQIHRRAHPWKDPRASRRVARVVRALAPWATRYGENGYRFELLDADVVNAFMGPAGRGYLYRGLLARVPSDDALAFVVGHELAHGELHHLDTALRASLAGRAVGAALGGEDAAKLGGLTAQLAAAVLHAVYDQDEEYEADRLGLCLAVTAGFAPRGALDAMGVLDRVAAARPRRPSDDVGGFAYDIVYSHPPTAQRRAYLERLIANLRRRGR